MQIIKTAVSLLILSASLFIQAYASELRVSSNPNRSASVLLEGASLVGNTYIYVQSTQSATKQVRFYLNSTTSSPATKIENIVPYDFGGTEPNNDAIAFNTATLNDGYHTLTAEIENNTGGIEVLESQFIVANSQPSLVVGDSLLETSTPEGTQSLTLNTAVSTNDGSSTPFTFSESTPWLDISASSTTTPANLNILLDTASLTPGEHQSVISFTASGLLSAQLTVRVLVTPLSSGNYQLFASSNSDRSSPISLAGSELAGNTHIFVSPEANIKQVQFFLDTPLTSPATKIENVKPYDLGGTQSNSDAIPFDTSTLTDGSHSLTAKVVLNDLSEEIITANFDVANSTNGFLLSPSSISENIATGSSPLIVNVLLGLNASSDGASPPYSAVSSANWLSVSPATSNAPETLTVTLDPAGLSNGTHTADIQITSPGYQTAILPVSLVVSSNGQTLQVNSQNINVTSQPNQGIVTRTINLTTSDSSNTNYSVASDSAWLTSSTITGITPEDISVNIDTNSLQIGSYQGLLTLSANGFDAITVVVNVNISQNNKCAPVTCADIKVSLPYELNFDVDNGHIKDNNNLGTGFTYLQPTSKGAGLISNNINVDTNNSTLQLTTTKGIRYKDNNNLDNAIGVGFAGPNQITDISTTIISPPSGSGNYEQAGLWFGYDEDHYLKLVVISDPSGTKVEFHHEENGQTVQSIAENLPFSAGEIELKLITIPSTKMVTAYFAIDSGTHFKVGDIEVPPEFFSFDAAGIDPEIGTRSFAGIFATHRHGNAPITYTFKQFSVVETSTPPSSSAFEFLRKSYSLSFPTSMVWGPDGRLYVTELFGTIHALTYDADLNVVDDEVINGLTNKHGARLTLGITFYQHSSTPGDFSLWVSHSSPSIDNGVANSGTVTRLSGPGFNTAEDIITGLPRAKANHAPNSLHFGPDDRLYMAIGGNTGAGSPVNVPTEFGDREEQPLSAALVVADVFASNFDGSCANNTNIYGPPPCDVKTYSTGLRNTYDFVFHSNGSIYAPDNGLGVTGAFPAQPFPDCSGFASPAPWNQGGQNPGEQPDILLQLQEGYYYGHPNPSIGECVFKDGSYQGVSPSLDYQPPLAVIGVHTSSNGVIEYHSNKACGELKGNLLITNYSLGDNIVRFVLDSSGNNVLSQESLVGGFNDPLTLSENDTGDLFVAEFGSGQITSLRHKSTGCWSPVASAPDAVLDAGSTSDATTLYMVGGKTTSGPVNSFYAYDTLTDSWSVLPPKPGVAVENPAAAYYDGHLYVFGGSTQPFSGAIGDAYRYNLNTGVWSSIAGMPTPRGGLRAEQIAGKIYLAGGMGQNGASLNTVEVYNPTSNSWSTLSPMNEKRDNPGTAIIDEQLYVVGGRERTASGTEINGTKTSIEVYNPTSDTWTNLSPMPTGRRTMVIGAIDNKIQVIGGEKNLNDPDFIFRQNEEYDPVTNTWVSLPQAPNPRHGAAFSTIDNRLFISGGGYKGGSAFTTDSEVFNY